MTNQGKTDCTVFNVRCRGTDIDGNPVLPERSAETAILRISNEIGARNQVFCRYLGRTEEGGVRDATIQDSCTVCQENRKVAYYVKDRLPLPRCHYIRFGYGDLG